MPKDQLKINEIFYSIQGEGSRAGEPCIFVRLMGCHLRCTYCDTAYAFYEGDTQSFEQILAEMTRLSADCRLVQVTGGEPLLQPGVFPFISLLCDAGYTVLVETSGACDISKCDPRAIMVMDLKTPGSGEMDRNMMSNIDHLKQDDELKFIITSREDYDWSKQVIEQYELDKKVSLILFSAVNAVPAGEELPGAEAFGHRTLAEWILEDNLPVRFQMQLHKLIWDPQKRGV